MMFLRIFTASVLVFQLSLGPLLAQPVLTQSSPFQTRPTTGITYLRVTSQSADGTEVVLTMDYGYDGFGGPTALIVPMIEKKGQKGVAAWFGADPVTIGVGKGLISIKVIYFNDEPGVPPQFTSDSLRVLVLNRGGTAILSSIPFLKTIKWGSPEAKPATTITLAQAPIKADESANAAKSRQPADAKGETKAAETARAKADSEAKARQKAEDESQRLAENRTRQEADRKAREEARLKADAESKRLAEEKRLADDKTRVEAKTRAEARHQADVEAKARREADQKARTEAAAREAAQRKAEAEAKRLAEETRKANDKAKVEARVKEKALLAAEAKTREEARKKAEADSERLAEARKQAESKARAESQARERAQLRAEAEEKARQEAELKERAESEARDAARLKAEADAKRLAEEKRLAELHAQEEAKAEAEANRRAEQARLAELKAKDAAAAKAKAEPKPLIATTAPTNSTSALVAAPASLATDLKTKITNVDVVNRSLDRSQMTIGVEYDYRDSLGAKPMLGVDVTRLNEPDSSKYFVSNPAEIGKSRRNFVLFPIKFQPPNPVAAFASYSTDNLLVYLTEATSTRRFNLYPATMLLTWRPPGTTQSPSSSPAGANKLELDDFKQNDPHAGYVTVKYSLVNGPGKLRVRVFDSKNPASLDWFAIEPKTVKTGPGLQIFDISVAPEAKTPGNIVSVDTLKIELVDATGKVVKDLIRTLPMIWAKPE